MTFEEAALAWCDRWFDEDASLLWNPEGSYDELAPPRSLHLVPQSGWYAAGLLRREGRGDVARAAAVFDRLCSLQYDEPGTVWHGTFARFAESPHPGPDAIEWVDYDPNWRQFLGTTFSLVLAEHEGTGAGGPALPGATAERMHAAIALAVAGEPPGRVPASYSNIALMRAWLEVEHGDATTRAAAEAYATDVVALFDRHGAFEEYNSPTYYGIDLYALGLWARRSTSATLTDHGRRIEAAVWDDVARWWHAGLRNLCGPWSRSYGMDMQSYAALLGLWIGPEAYPSLDEPFDHSHDTTFAPMVAYVGRSVPAAVERALVAFDGGERVVEQQVTGDRVATGWLSPQYMAGGEAGGAFPARGQYHPATAHWAGGWLRVRHEGPVDAVASPGRLTVDARDDGAFTLIVGGAGGPLPVVATASGRPVDLAAGGGGGKVRVTGARSVVVEFS